MKSWKQTINKWQFLLSILAAVLAVVATYQLEIVFIDMDLKRPFCYPFNIYCTYEYWIARDVWYALIYLAFALMAYAIWKWE
jgi:hypothetical protein